MQESNNLKIEEKLAIIIIFSTKSPQTLVSEVNFELLLLRADLVLIQASSGDLIKVQIPICRLLLVCNMKIVRFGPKP